ncbi:MAG: hypothetical protein IT379_30890 [Deltaproteobacteria bacterium]|nr:hypothetical protein [Deltaproteobacteria bacterium]
MTREPNSAHRGLAVAAAAAGLTLAIGVTIGALLGFVRTPFSASIAEPDAPVAPSAEPAPSAERIVAVAAPTVAPPAPLETSDVWLPAAPTGAPSGALHAPADPRSCGDGEHEGDDHDDDDHDDDDHDDDDDQEDDHDERARRHDEHHDDD